MGKGIDVAVGVKVGIVRGISVVRDGCVSISVDFPHAERKSKKEANKVILLFMFIYRSNNSKMPHAVKNSENDTNFV